MQVLKKHIALLLLSGFLFPQVVNGVHYLMVPHGFSSEKPNGKITITKSDLDFRYHSCHYHLQSFSSVLASEDKLKDFNFITPEAKLNFCSLENYVHHQDFNFQLRGPPLL